MISTLRTALWRRQCTYAVAAWMACAAAGAVAADFVPERLKDGTALPADMPRLYVSDFSIGHLMDGRVSVLDARNGKYMGLIDSGYAGLFTVAPDAKQVYVTATYLTRGSHGDRHDVTEIYDADTLRMTGDVELPPRHAQASYLHELSRTSFDGHYLFVQNATPATSISVVDLQAKRMLTEVPSAGCWGIYPSATEALRFSMLCGDGKMTTLTLDADGKVAQRASTGKFFDSSTDPVFMSTVAQDGRNYLVSFAGTLHRIDTRGPQPVIESSVPFVTAADRKGGWLPGGYQLVALDAERRRLLVGMHPNGKEGQHKSPAQEIWTLDLATGKRVARTKAKNATVLEVGKSGPRYLYALNGATSQVVAYELPGMREVFVSDPVGEAPVQLDAP